MTIKKWIVLFEQNLMSSQSKIILNSKQLELTIDRLSVEIIENLKNFEKNAFENILKTLLKQRQYA